MDAFESLVAMLLRQTGFWVTPSFKVNLTKREKSSIGTATMPRLELDLVAYSGRKNEVLVVECKSFLDSPGVRFAGFDGTSARFARRYKLFNSSRTRKIVFRRLEKQLLEVGACRSRPKIRLALAAGRILNSKDRNYLHKFFKRKGWVLFDEDWLLKGLEAAASGSYEDDVGSVVSKLILRSQKFQKKKV